jgi:hypothetical protein
MIERLQQEKVGALGESVTEAEREGRGSVKRDVHRANSSLLGDEIPVNVAGRAVRGI